MWEALPPPPHKSVNPLKRFRYWLAKSLLDQLADIHTQDLVNNCQFSYEQGLRVGQAFGQLQGQQHILSQLAQNQAVSPEEIETVRIGLVH